MDRCHTSHVSERNWEKGRANGSLCIERPFVLPPFDSSRHRSLFFGRVITEIVYFTPNINSKHIKWYLCLHFILSMTHVTMTKKRILLFCVTCRQGKQKSNSKSSSAHHGTFLSFPLDFDFVSNLLNRATNHCG